ncbi:hypothetical protein CFP56_029673 [Quercus suber]|uniref:DUF4220 domain-containing protein n=1 Tax=Quercus suber TaxID=58331 RepID=A0AAW0JS01_QUESU
MTFFFIIEKHEYSRENVVITYVLVAGAVILELYAAILLLCSDWMMLSLKKHNLLYQAISSLPFTRSKRWSNTMTQHNLISTYLEYKPANCRFLTMVLCIDALLEKHRYKYSKKVPPKLKKVIFDQLSNESISVSDIKECKKFCDDRGYEVLEGAISSVGIRDGDGETIEESVDKLKVEFDKSILLWHIATDLCLSSDKQKDLKLVKTPHCKASKRLSNYLLYLLVVCPVMLPNGIGQIRFRDTCAEANEFFKERKSKLVGGNVGKMLHTKKLNACSMLLQVNTEIPPSKVKGDRSKSVLFDACRLAKSLQSLATAKEWDSAKKWELICHVWVEMLSYAASHCQWNHHAQQLTQGGELLTHVWLLKMLHTKKLNACSMLLQVNTEIPPSKVKGDRSKSVLFDACRLAKSLQSLATAKEWDSAKKWELICHVWVEMLSYAASHCQWNHHAQQLTQGGELLTHVWLLIAHLGITEQFQISQGHERAKLNVE